MKVKFYMQVDNGKKVHVATADVKSDHDIPRFLHDFADHMQAEMAKERRKGE